MIDLWQSRRDTFVKVKYWSQIDNEDLVSNSRITYTKHPTGSFLAKEVTVHTSDAQVVGETMMFDDKNVTLYTRDKISNLRVNDMVEYDGKRYRVDNIQKKYMQNQRQFMREQSSAYYYITLRG